MTGKVYFVATPIGNLEDMTFRAVRILQEVDLILAEDTRKTRQLLHHFEIQNKMTSFYRHNEGMKLDSVLQLLEEGKQLAVVSDAGTPGISDPGEDLVKAAIERGIPIVPIPGACAFIQGLIASGFDTTRFVFEGFLSMNKRARKERLQELQNETRTILFYEAPHKLTRTLQDLKNAFGADRRIVLARELTKIHEEFLRMTIEEAIQYYEEKEVKGEFVVLVEGKQKEVPKVSEESIETLMEEALASGLERKEAMKQVAKQKGVTKSEVYQYLVNHKE